MDVKIEKPKIEEPLSYAYSVSQEEMERFRRKKRRAEEIGIRLFVLDGEKISEELQELEDYIIDNYLDRDLDVPDELKEKYSKLKKQIEGQVARHEQTRQR